MGGLATGESDSKGPGEEVLVAIDRGKGDVMCLEGTGELAFQAFQLLHQPGAATRWQEEGIGRRLKAAADAEPAKRFSECFFNLPGLSLDHIRGTEDHELGHVKCRQPVGKSRSPTLSASAGADDECRAVIAGDRRSRDASIPMKAGRRRQVSRTGSRCTVTPTDDDLLGEVREILRRGQHLPVDVRRGLDRRIGQRRQAHGEKRSPAGEQFGRRTPQEGRAILG